MDPPSSPRRRWHQVSERWKQQLEKVAHAEKIIKVGIFQFVNDEQFRIAKGSDGTEVFLGLRDDGMEVAIKRVSKINYEVLENEENFLCLPALDNDLIVRYMGFVEDEHFGYLILQLCESTLEEHIKTITDFELKKLAEQFLNSLKILHSQNPPILHRDIKPQNVLIDIRGRARLCDFGISTQLQQGQTSETTLVTSSAGTKCWRAKETLNGSDGTRVPYTCSSEIQVAGMVMYYILSGGEHPFGGGLRCEGNILGGNYNLVHVQDEYAKDLIEWMLDGDPTKRPTVEECLDHDFFQCTKGYELSKVRNTFIQKVSAPVVIDLILDLLEDGIWTDKKKCSPFKNCTTTSERANMLIDIVLKKGGKACFKMMFHLKIRDNDLFTYLGLSSVLPVDVTDTTILTYSEVEQMAPSDGKVITEKQLLQVARQLGNEWKPLGVHLGLRSRDLKEIDKEHDLTMQKLMMLLKWRNRQRPEKATVRHLWKLLKDLDYLPREVLQTLEGMKLSLVWSPFIQTLTAPVLLDLIEDLKDEILTEEEKCGKELDTCTTKSKMTCMLIKIVQSKGVKASWQMMSYLQMKYPEIYSKLGLLTSSDLPAIAGCSSSWQSGSTTSVLPDAFKEEKLKKEMQTVNSSSEEEEDEHSEGLMEMMDNMKISGEEGCSSSWQTGSMASVLTDAFKEEKLEKEMQTVNSSSEEEEDECSEGLMEMMDNMKISGEEGMKLSLVWSPFIQTLTAPVLLDLIEDLKDEILTEEEKCGKELDTCTTKSKMACMLIKIVQSKGEKASSQIMSHLKMTYPELYSKLGLLTSSDLPAIAGCSSSWQTGSTASVLTDAFKEEKLEKEMQTVNSSSEEEEDKRSEGWMEMMDNMKISGEEELMRTGLDDSENDEVYKRSQCEKCQHIQQSCGNERIVPDKFSRGRYLAQLKGEGTYECVFTGLIFKASEQVLVCYSVLSWSKFSKFLQNPWMIAGPIFNVQTVNKDASAIKYIKLPHFLCLTGLENEKVFGVLHITGKNPSIEPVEYSGSHLKWSVSSLSPVGCITQRTPVEYHGAVLIYKDLSSNDDDVLILRIYLTPNNSSSHVEDIKKHLPKRYSRVDKSVDCKLIDPTSYHLMSDQTGVEIHPKVLMFTLEELVHKGFFEVQYEEPPHIKFKLPLQLKASEADKKDIWSTIIRKGDLDNCREEQPNTRNMCDVVGSTDKKPKKRTIICTTKRCDDSEEGPSKRRGLSQQPGLIVKAKELLRTNKTKLQGILMAEIGHVVQCVCEHEEKLLVDFEYLNLKGISDPGKAATELVDKIMGKGETTCQAFLSLLQDTKLTDLFPDLKEMPWYNP